MNKHISIDQRKELHGADYVAIYETNTPARIARLVDRMDLPSGADVADFGCGNAMVLDHIKDKVRSYTGVDFSEPFIAAANARKSRLGVENARFLCMPIEAFCAKHPSAFDVVFAFDLSEHVYDDEWQVIVDGMHKALRPGGVVYLHTPNLAFFLEQMKRKNFVLRQFPEHIAVRDGAGNAAFFQRAGFQRIKVEYISHYNILRLVHPLSALPWLGRHFQARIFLSAMKAA